MSNIQKHGHDIGSFINELLSHNPLPQKSEYIHKDTIIITFQYIPGKGFVVGYQDKRVSHKVNPVMMFADLHYERVKDTLPKESFRDIIMNTPVLSKKALAIKTDEELELKLNIQHAKMELQQVAIEVIFEAELAYDKNSRSLGQRPVFTKLN